MKPLPPALALLPLRAFLGVTFAYAGVQKLADPGFLEPGAPTYIGTQLKGFADGTPGGWLLDTFALPHPQLAGVAVAVTEILIGLLVLVGLATRIAAAAGLGLSLVLFLTASWKTSPYFLGPDIVFAFAWLPFVLGGTAGQPALERLSAPAGLTRRQAMGSGALAVAGAAVLLAELAAALKARVPEIIATGSRPRPMNAPAAGKPVRLGPAERLSPDSGVLFDDPSSGEPVIVVRHPSGELSACSAVCTHAGCSVGYSGGALRCPCHGSEFDSRTGAVRRGPATEPLAVKRVIERGGDLYAVSDGAA